MTKLIVQRTPLWRLLLGSHGATISEVDEGIEVSANGDPSQVLSVRQMRHFVRVIPGILSARAEVETPDGLTLLRGFPRAALAQLVDRTNAKFEACAREVLDPAMDELRQTGLDIENLLSGRNYARSSNRVRLVERCEKALLMTENSRWDLFARKEERELAARIRSFTQGSEGAVEESNARYVENHLSSFKEFFDTIESKPLTDSQRRACVAGEDNNLVLAGAGTGKTSTMIGRAGYLLASGLAQPDELLMLAFARKAREEMQDRQNTHLGRLVGGNLPTIKTFHALGLEIIGQVEGKRPDLTPLAEDGHRLARFIDEQMAALIETEEYRNSLLSYFGNERFPYRNPFDFESMQDYYEYVRSNELRTLKNEVVKSFEECVIANFLSFHGVHYEYEKPYKVDTSGPDFRQYRPDFYLSDYDIYIEHFALGSDGQPPKHFDQQKYLEGVAWKRELHEQNGTKLIETYSYLKRAGRLESYLAESLEAAGVSLCRRSDDELLQELQESSLVSDIAEVIGRFVGLYKQSDLSLEDLRASVGAHIDSARLALLLGLITPVIDAYEKHLRSDGHIDFGDMIRRATEYVEDGRYRSPYAHLLVDEFQDISGARARLIIALLRQRPDSMLFAVGDDWQTIYRFAGSDIGYTRDFDQVFGATFNVALETTFRFNNQIGAVASRFVLKNPGQIPKSIASLTQSDVPEVSLVGVLHLPDGLELALNAINARAEISRKKKPSVLVLARYKFQLADGDDAKIEKNVRATFPALDIDFMTVHAAKGKEADYVVVVGLGKGKYGFPSEYPNDALLELLLPGQEEFLHAEERRLFYVAMTRARHRVYLVFNSIEASSFITELGDEPE